MRRRLQLVAQKVLFASLAVYYWAKVQLYRLLVGKDALACVLHDSLVPSVVLRLGGAKVGEGTRVNRWLIIHESGGTFETLTIGNYVHVGKGVLLDLTVPLTIGDRVGIGMFVRILTHQNMGDSRLKEFYPVESGRMTIPDDVVLGAGSTVLFPTTLVAGTLVAAGSVVRGVYEKPCVLMGNPARVLRILEGAGDHRGQG